MQALRVAMCGPDVVLLDALADGVELDELAELLLDDPPHAASRSAAKGIAMYRAAAGLGMAAVVSQGTSPVSTDKSLSPTADKITRRAEVAQLGRALD
jgi:hypothetical protein